MSGEGRSRNPIEWVLVALVRGYQQIISPWFAPTCKYYPSCSNYAIGALRTHGPLRGLGLTAWRLLRCNPWSAGGVDHVPPPRAPRTERHQHQHSAHEGRTLVGSPVRMGSHRA